MTRIISVLLVFTTFMIEAHQVSFNEAKKTASDFFNSNTSRSADKVSRRVVNIMCPNAVASGAWQPYYIFNAADNKGFVIVSGDDRTSRILGYSNEGNIDIDKMPLQLEQLLNRYSNSIMTIGERIPIKTTSNGKSVAPLIKSEWGQNYPYNSMLPIIYDDVKAATGCVNTAQAQIMRYHKFPIEHGSGILSYTSSYGDTYSVNLSESRYEWDEMLDKYEYTNSENSFLTKNESAVALLFRDIAYVNRTSFGNESGATINYAALTDNFGYDKSIHIIDYMHLELGEYEALLRAELDGGRPFFVCGSSGNGSSAHEFICDGYDEHGYFHYNFGWDGGYNGYFLSTATGFEQGHFAIIGIQPDCGGGVVNVAGSDADFEYGGDIIRCNLYHGNVFEYPMEHVVATVCENVLTGQKTYITGYSGLDWFNINEMPLPGDLYDGEYILYPAMRVEGGEWQNYKFVHGRQSYIDLSVVDGVKKYTNNNISDILDDGKLELDGIYYILHEDNIAEVTFRNDKYNSYSGDVVIPEYIDVNGVRFTVSIIGRDAFNKCQIQTLRFPRSINLIRGAFYMCSVDKIIFDEPSDLKELEGWAFNTINVEELRLPHGLESVGTCALQTFGGSLIEIPSSVKSFGRYPFAGSLALKDVIVHWEKESDMPLIQPDYHLFDQCNWKEMTLYVPKGTVEMYRKAPQWSDLNIKEMSDYDRIDEISVDDGEMSPIYIDLMGRQWNGVLRPGIYIKITGKKTTKVMIR